MEFGSFMEFHFREGVTQAEAYGLHVAPPC